MGGKVAKGKTKAGAGAPRARRGRPAVHNVGGAAGAVSLSMFGRWAGRRKWTTEEARKFAALRLKLANAEAVPESLGASLRAGRRGDVVDPLPARFVEVAEGWLARERKRGTV